MGGKPFRDGINPNNFLIIKLDSPRINEFSEYEEMMKSHIYGLEYPCWISSINSMMFLFLTNDLSKRSHFKKSMGLVDFLGVSKVPNRSWISTRIVFNTKSHLPVKHTFFTHTKKKTISNIRTFTFTSRWKSNTNTNTLDPPLASFPRFCPPPFFRFRFGLQETDGSQQHHDFFPRMGG